MTDFGMEQIDFRGPFSLYIHIPFCERKCSYCDFYSLKYSPGEMEAFLEALGREIGLYGRLLPGGELDTIYLGGGTPSLLSPEQLAVLLEMVLDSFSPPRSGEVTLESNPSSLNGEKLTSYRNAGINRLSLGVQSFNDQELTLLGRLHTRKEAERVVNEVRGVFENYSLDLISSLPGQTLSSWEESLCRALSFLPPHLSIYNLQLEEGTTLGELYRKGELTPVDEELDARIFLQNEEILCSEGYEHYEISNYARPGYHSRHNRNYWEYRPYLGLGPAAHSFDGKHRFYNYRDLGIYLERLSRRELPVEELTELTLKEQMAEMLFMGLRLKEGVSCRRFEELTGSRLGDIYREELAELEEKGLIIIEGERLKLSRRGTLLGNEVFLSFL